MELKKFLAISCICFSSVFGSNEIINEENPQREKHWFSKIYRTMEDAEYELSQHKNSSCIRIRKYAEDKFGFYVRNIKFPFSKRCICMNPRKRFLLKLCTRYKNLLSSGDVNIIPEQYFDNEFELINWYELNFSFFEEANFALNQHPEIAEYFDMVECITEDYYHLYWKIMLKPELQEIYSHHNGLTTEYQQISV